MENNNYCGTCWPGTAGMSGQAWVEATARWRVCDKCRYTRKVNEAAAIAPAKTEPIQVVISPPAGVPAKPEVKNAVSGVDVVLALGEVTSAANNLQTRFNEVCSSYERAAALLFGDRCSPVGELARRFHVLSTLVSDKIELLRGGIARVQNLIGKLPSVEADFRLTQFLDKMRKDYPEYACLNDDQLMIELNGSTIEARDFVVQHGDERYSLVRARTVAEAYNRRCGPRGDMRVTINGKLYDRDSIDDMLKKS